jgi:hypothetical protein
VVNFPAEIDTSSAIVENTIFRVTLMSSGKDIAANDAIDPIDTSTPDVANLLSVSVVTLSILPNVNPDVYPPTVVSFGRDIVVAASILLGEKSLLTLTSSGIDIDVNLVAPFGENDP